MNIQAIVILQSTKATFILYTWVMEGKLASLFGILVSLAVSYFLQ